MTMYSSEAIEQKHRTATGLLNNPSLETKLSCPTYTYQLVQHHFLIDHPEHMSISLGSESATRPTFSGARDEDVAVFIHNIQRVAFAMGKQRDNDWQADYASTCLLGNAMRWYSELEDDDTRYSWSLLRRALSQRFPLPVPDVIIESSANPIAGLVEDETDDAPPSYDSTLQSPEDTRSVVSLTPSRLS